MQREIAKYLHDIRSSCELIAQFVKGALANCTMGEMVQALADIYGRYTGGPEW